ncbi:MAG: mevalonate kinase [Chitinophagaceae bacterium]|nr:mevalonate kinase [Oligoflexus sp.]
MKDRESETQYPDFRTSKLIVPSIETTACGKAIIVGEHAVVYGAHAVAIPLHQMRFRFHMTPKPSRNGHAPEVHLKLAGHEGSPRLQAVVIKAMQLLGIDAFSLDGETHSSLPIGAGLGSSATLCVAVLRALSQSHAITLSNTQLATFANELEKSFHGNPSGLDTAVVAFEKPVLFAKKREIKMISIDAGQSFEFVLIDSNIRASTMSMIRIAQPYFTGANGDSHIDRFDQLSLAAYQSLQSGNTLGLAASMNEAGHLLEDAGVVPANLFDMIIQTRALGALAVKSTGAGGGGMIIGLLDPNHCDEHHKRIVDHFKGHGVYRVTLNSSL